MAPDTAAFDTATRRESPTVFAKRLGLTRSRSASASHAVLSWDNVLDMAALAYWDRRHHAAA